MARNKFSNDMLSFAKKKRLAGHSWTEVAELLADKFIIDEDMPVPNGYNLRHHTEGKYGPIKINRKTKYKAEHYRFAIKLLEKCASLKYVQEVMLKKFNVECTTGFFNLLIQNNGGQIVEAKLPDKIILLAKTLKAVGTDAEDIQARMEALLGIELNMSRFTPAIKSSPLEPDLNFGQIIVEPRKVTIKKGSLFITSTIPSTKVESISANGVITWRVNTNRGAMKSIKTWLGAGKDRSPIIFPMRAHVGALTKQPTSYDRIISEFRDVFATDVSINDNLHLFDAQLNPQKINPLTGLHAIDYLAGGAEDSNVNKRKSLIVASPKQGLLTVPQGKELRPRIMTSMGSISERNVYRRTEFQGRIAEALHVEGGIIVDIDGDWFSIRHVQFSEKDGSFVDMGKRYCPNGKVKDEPTKGMTPGDLHLGEHSPLALDTTMDQINFFNPEEVFWQDMVTWITISHWIQKDSKARSMIRAHIGFLYNEVDLIKGCIDYIASKTPKGTRNNVVADSNHLEHINRYLSELRWQKDEPNHDLASDLYPAYRRGMDPTRLLVDSTVHPLNAALTGDYGKSKFNWLEKNKDFWIDRVQFNSHGHQGIQGARGSKNSTALSYGRANTGHTHNPFIHNGVYGTGTHHAILHNEDVPAPHFTDGQVRSWGHANIIQYQEGMRQLIFSIKGRWKL